MEEKKLIKFEGDSIQKVGNVIAISNKLITEKYIEQANDLQYKQGKFNDANRFYLKAIELMPNHIDALNNCAQNLRLNIKNYQEAVFYYSKVIDLNPQYENALFQRGLCKGQLGDYLGNISDLSKLIEYATNELHLYISRALIKRKINDYKGMIEDCTYVISIDKNNSSAFQLRGEAKVALSDFNEGISDLEKAIEIEEAKFENISVSKPIMLFGKIKHCGMAKLTIHDFQGALDNFDRLVAIAPQNPQSYKLRASANEKIGNKESYKKDMEIFHKLNNEHFGKYGFSF